MAFSVVMPALEMAQETGKLIAWRKKEGDSVSKGEPLLEIETDKAVVEVEAPADGVLAGINAAEGAEIPVGQTIAWIVAPGEQPPKDNAAIAPAARGSYARQTAPRTERKSAPDSRVRISPKARSLAKEFGVDIATVRGSGPGGEILAADVEMASHSANNIASRVTPARTSAIEVPTSIGRIMAERTAQSWTTVPHFFVSRDLDAVELNSFRSRVAAEIERAHQVRITHTDMLIAIVSRVLVKHPRMNASWTAEGIQLHEHVNMGLAIAVNDGVVAAIIPKAHAASLAEIARRRQDVADRARGARLRPADIADATFTISNLGMYGVDQFGAIITSPQAAILAVGKIADRVVAIDGKPAVRSMMTVTLSCDHRVVDGARAAEFLRDLATAVANPEACLTGTG